jgi:hypothetical protein
MTVNAGTDIVENGLVVNYDPANLNSFLNTTSYTNLVAYPEDMSYWTTGPAVNYVNSTLNAIVAPDGTTTADKLYEVSGTGTIHIFALTSFLTTGVNYNVSFYAKAGERKILGCGSNNGLGSIKVDLSLGTIVSGSGRIFPVGNGWYKVLTTITPGGGRGIYMGICDDSGNNVYNGDGSSGLYVWGVRAELADNWTNYTSVGGTTLRHILKNDVSTLYPAGIVGSVGYSSSNSGSFTFNGSANNFIQLYPNMLQHESGNPFTISFWFKSSNNAGLFGQGTNIDPSLGAGWVPAAYIDSSGYLRTSFFWGGATTNQSVSSIVVNDSIWRNLTVTFASNSHKSYLNGTLYDTISKTQNYYSATYNYFLGAAPVGGWPNSSSTWLNGNISQFLYYNRALSDTEILKNFNATRGRFNV